MVAAIVIIAITAGLVVFVSYPLLTRSTRHVMTESERRLNDLLTRRDELFHDIRETELDFRTGKLAESDYDANIVALKTEAAEVIAGIEKIDAAASGAPGDVRPMSEVVSDIESLIAAARTSAKQQPAASTPPQKSEDNACPSCGAANPADARSCTKCGVSLATEMEGKQ